MDNHNIFYLYQLCGEYDAFHELKKHIELGIWNDIIQDPRAIYHVMGSFRFSLRYPKNFETLEFMLILQHLYLNEVLKYPYISSTAILRTQLLYDSLKHDNEISYAAFNITNERFDISCSNALGFSEKNRVQFSPIVYEKLSNMNIKKPFCCVVNMVEADNCKEMQWLAAVDIHRFVLVGLKPKPFNIFQMKDEDKTSKSLLRYANNADFHCVENVLNFSYTMGKFHYISSLN